MITHKQVRELFDYDAETGEFTVKVRRGKSLVGSKTKGSLTPDGYYELRIYDKLYKAHRIAWLWYHGYLPEQLVDHINGNKLDNRINNLRETSKACNAQNSKVHSTNTSGYRGVTKDKRKENWWAAQVHHKGKGIFIGRYYDPLEAALARLTWEDWCCDWNCDAQCVNRQKVLQDAGLLKEGNE